MIVIDASALLEILLVTPLAVRFNERIFSPSETLHAPHLIDLEIAQVLWRYLATGELGAERAKQAMDDLGDMAIYRYPHTPLLPRIWQLRHNVTAYDASYVALAEILEAPLLTSDARLASSPGHEATIELLE